MGKPSQSYEASPAIRDRIVLPATQQRLMCPSWTPGKQAST